jgi:hypothetical protein
MRKASIIKMQQENLADIKHKLLIIYNHIQLMHNELRYQAKTYTISEKLSKEKKNSASSPPIYIYIYLLKTNKQKNNKDMLMEKEMTSSPSM